MPPHTGRGGSGRLLRLSGVSVSSSVRWGGFCHLSRRAVVRIKGEDRQEALGWERARA